MERIPTIHDVAFTAGVSPATVSRYLQGQRVRSAPAVREAIADLGFRPSAAARSLKSGLTRSIAVVVPDVTNPYFAAVVKGVESVSRRDAYTIFLYNTEESSEREAAILADLGRRVDGMILAPADESTEAQERLRAADLPIVLLDREVGRDGEFDSVLVDSDAGARQAAEYLLSLGHERIGLISGPLETTPGRARHEGFLAVLQAAEIDLPDALVQVADFREDGGYQATMRLLALESPPTAIFAANNLMSVGALHALHDMRVRIPEEVSILGFDDLQLAELLSPPLTVVDRPMEEQGVLAMRLLLNRLDGRSETPRRIVLDTNLVIRESCAAPTHSPQPRFLNGRTSP